MKSLTVLVILLAAVFAQKPPPKKCGGTDFIDVAAALNAAVNEIIKKGVLDANVLQELGTSLVNLADDCLGQNFDYPNKACYPDAERLERDVRSLAFDLMAQQKSFLKIAKDIEYLLVDLNNFRTQCLASGLQRMF